MPSCVLCGYPAAHLLIYELQDHRVEVLLCETHLELVREDMPELPEESKINVKVEPMTIDSLIPGPRATRFPLET